ncbi:proline and serine-rich protein 3 [Alosa pseudoharengus]|uniref:proline and serine-rich protein 3 n=1 Tax=Alosa pseudoharengus TaxID=34774 RepID=UPI003F8A38E4
MQDKVSRLLDVNTHSLSNDSPLVSPEGLGCSDDLSLENIGKPLENSLHCSDHAINSNFSKYLTPTQTLAVGYLASGMKPEDDILYQWRLRRKMEQCGRQPQSDLQLPVPYGSLCSLLQQTQKNLLTRDHSSTVIGTMAQASSDICTQEPPPPFTFPHPSLSQFQPKHHISPRTSHINDILPCPLQSSPMLLPKESKQHLRKSSTDTATCTPLSTDQLNFKNTPDYHRNKSHSSLHRYLPENKEGHCLISKKSGKGGKGVMSQRVGTEAETRKKINGTSSSREKSSRFGRHMEQSDPTLGRHMDQSDPALRGDQDGKRLKRKDSHKARRREASALSPSPLQSTLGMVVSEVLFPDFGSADTTRMSSTDSFEDTQSFPPQPLTTPHRLQRPSEIINKLLIEAEDSDELEFEDDPLLLVLREQRGWVKQRICDMDMLLEAWHEKQPL